MNNLNLRIISSLVLFIVTGLSLYVGGMFVHSVIFLFLVLSIKEIASINGYCTFPSFLIKIGFVIYVSSAFLALSFLYEKHGPWSIVWLILLISANDTGAYFVGKKIQGPKLSPRISPGKTWSGLVGGLLLGSCAAYFSASFFIPIRMNFLLCVILSLSGHLGDLLESAFKRYYGIKDSGKLIPGHGGVLDRMDSLLMASLWAMMFL